MLTLTDLVAELPMSEKSVRLLFSDKGGPIYRLPTNNGRVLTTRRFVDVWLEGLGQLAGEIEGLESCVTVVEGPVFS